MDPFEGARRFSRPLQKQKKTLPPTASIHPPFTDHFDHKPEARHFVLDEDAVILRRSVFEKYCGRCSWSFDELVELLTKAEDEDRQKKQEGLETFRRKRHAERLADPEEQAESTKNIPCQSHEDPISSCVGAVRLDGADPGWAELLPEDFTALAQHQAAVLRCGTVVTASRRHCSDFGRRIPADVDAIAESLLIPFPSRRAAQIAGVAANGDGQAGAEADAKTLPKTDEHAHELEDGLGTSGPASCAHAHGKNNKGERGATRSLSFRPPKGGWQTYFAREDHAYRLQQRQAMLKEEEQNRFAATNEGKGAAGENSTQGTRMKSTAEPQWMHGYYGKKAKMPELPDNPVRQEGTTPLDDAVPDDEDRDDAAYVSALLGPGDTVQRFLHQLDVYADRQRDRCIAHIGQCDQLAKYFERQAALGWIYVKSNRRTEIYDRALTLLDELAPSCYDANSHRPAEFFPRISFELTNIGNHVLVEGNAAEVVGQSLVDWADYFSPERSTLAGRLLLDNPKYRGGLWTFRVRDTLQCALSCHAVVALNAFGTEVAAKLMEAISSTQSDRGVDVAPAALQNAKFSSGMRSPTLHRRGIDLLYEVDEQGRRSLEVEQRLQKRLLDTRFRHPVHGPSMFWTNELVQYELYWGQRMPAEACMLLSIDITFAVGDKLTSSRKAEMDEDEARKMPERIASQLTGGHRLYYHAELDRCDEYDDHGGRLLLTLFVHPVLGQIVGCNLVFTSLRDFETTHQREESMLEGEVLFYEEKGIPIPYNLPEWDGVTLSIEKPRDGDETKYRWGVRIGNGKSVTESLSQGETRPMEDLELWGVFYFDSEVEASAFLDEYAALLYIAHDFSATPEWARITTGYRDYLGWFDDVYPDFSGGLSFDCVKFWIDELLDEEDCRNDETSAGTVDDYYPTTTPTCPNPDLRLPSLGDATWLDLTRAVMQYRLKNKEDVRAPIKIRTVFTMDHLVADS